MCVMMKLLSLCMALAAAGCNSKAPTTADEPVIQGSWPRFLGPTGNNVTDAKGLPIVWQDKKGKNIKWKVPLPGEGWSSPVIGEGRIYCTTALNDGKSLRALCVSLKDGQLLWDVEVLKV